MLNKIVFSLIKWVPIRVKKQFLENFHKEPNIHIVFKDEEKLQKFDAKLFKKIPKVLANEANAGLVSRVNFADGKLFRRLSNASNP